MYIWCIYFVTCVYILIIFFYVATNYSGTEKDDSQKYHPGNQEKDGFGHIAFNTDDVYAAADKLEKAGVKFKKKPGKNLLSILDDC